MVTWSANLARADRSFAAIVKIEGVGRWLSDDDLSFSDGDGMYQFVTAFAEYMTGSPGDTVVDSGSGAFSAGAAVIELVGGPTFDGVTAGMTFYHADLDQEFGIITVTDSTHITLDTDIGALLVMVSGTQGAGNQGLADPPVPAGAGFHFFDTINNACEFIGSSLHRDVVGGDILNREGNDYTIYDVTDQSNLRCTVQCGTVTHSAWSIRSGALSDWEVRTAAGAPDIYRDYITEMPDLLSERADPNGGFPEMGELSFSLLDFADFLTDLVRTENAPITRLSETLTVSTDTFDVDDIATITEESVIFIDSEAMRVTVVSGTTITVDRGYLGTDAIAHAVRRPVFDYVPYLRNRRVSLYAVPLDGSDDDKQLMGSYAIDSLEWDEPLNAWLFKAKSQLKYLHRMAPTQPRSARVVRVEPPPMKPVLQSYTGNGSIDSTIENVWGDGGFLKNGSEILLMNRSDISRRDLLGSGEEDFKVGQLVSWVLVADRVIGSFRYSPGPSPSTSRSSGTWTVSSHWVDICLNILTSSAYSSGGISDGLELTNYDSDFGNYSSLPPGYGLGVPASTIDWSSWLAVKARTLDYEFPDFVFGDEPVPFADLLDQHFLKALGAYVSMQNGVAKLILPRIPMQGEATVTLGASEILAKKVGQGQYLPRIGVRQHLAQQVGSVIYRIGPRLAPITLNNADIAQFSYYGTDDKPISIDVPGVDPSATGFLMRCAERKLFRWHRPRMAIDADVDFSKFDNYPGDLLSFDLSEIPNLRGTRGASSMLLELLEREPRLDQQDGAYVAMRFEAYGPGINVGRICPSAYVASVASNTATVTANRYTQSDALGGLPATDAAGFAVGDVVAIKNLNGTAGGGTTQTISGISGNAITLNGNFGGSLASGKILVYAAAASQVTAQSTRFVSFADRATGTVGAGSTSAWLYGEP